MAAGCAKVFKEKVSGAKTDRPELAKAIGRLEPGDVVVVTRLDRLARSTRDLLNVLDQIGKRGAGFKSLKDTWADTTTAHGRLMLTVLGGLAELGGANGSGGQLDSEGFSPTPRTYKSLPVHAEAAVSSQSGFRGGAHARPKATTVHHAARWRGCSVAARGARAGAGSPGDWVSQC
jgi:Resolvase, N terminal domain